MITLSGFHCIFIIISSILLTITGGFDLAHHQGGYCDVQTATGISVRKREKCN